MRGASVCLLAVLACQAGAPASRLYREALAAERDGDAVRACLLYSLAAAQDPYNPIYWTRAQALRQKVGTSGTPAPRPALVGLCPASTFLFGGDANPHQCFPQHAPTQSNGYAISS
jgi:hypothetical protein